MLFKDRQEAGQELAGRLSGYGRMPHVVVLALPRGGVPVAYEIACALHAPLDLFLSRKLGVPGHEELAFGAISADGELYLDREIVAATAISQAEIERIARNTQEKLKENALRYRSGRPPLQVKEKTVILVDDGIATGASIHAAARALRQAPPKKLVVAAPVAPSSACSRIREAVDELIVLHTPRNFYAVGQFYSSFPQVSDEEVIDLLQRAAKACPGD